MDKVIFGLISLLLAAATYHFWNKVDGLEKALEDEKQKNQIRISNATLSEVSRFEFLDVQNDFSYLLDKKYGSGAKHERVTALYGWTYQFSFGFDLSSGWDWCPEVVDEKLGIVEVAVPDVVQTNSNAPAPEPVKVFNGAYWDDHKTAVSEEVSEYAHKKVKEMADAYLNNPTTVSSVQRSLSKHLQSVMNAAHSNANPISEVRLKSGSACSA